MSARESIAWMRICRPGSVIGQQQGWLEKIESWLWRQGSHYRLQHFGDGDKIPHHRYGVYSKEWPLERRRLIFQAQKTLETQEKQFPRLKNGSPQRLSAPPQKTVTSYKVKRPESEKRRSSIEKNNEYQKIAKLIAKPHISTHINDENEYTDKNLKLADPPHHNTNLKGKLKELSNVDNGDIKKAKEKLETERTQGDRLNDIKIRRQNNLETKARTIGKHKTKKDTSFSPHEKISTRGDSFIYTKRNSSPLYYLTDINGSYITPEHTKKRFEIDHRRLLKNVIN